MGWWDVVGGGGGGDIIGGGREFLNDANHSQVVSITLFVAILCVCIVVGHLLEENRWVNESITAILIGCITGIIILSLSKGASSHILRFDEDLFFIYLLPPIIFNAGFQVKKKQFFRNFSTIMLFGVIGVFISTAIISVGNIQVLLYFPLGFLKILITIGTIFSSTDTVCTLQVLHQDDTPLLYSLVFGEGVVNDATTVVLFNAVQKIDVSKFNGWASVKILGDFLYLFCTSTGLGVFVSADSRAIKCESILVDRHSTDREVGIMVLMAYLSYMLAEISSGLPTCAMHLFATMSFIAETFIFLYVGMDALDLEKWKISKTSFKTNISIYSVIIFLISVGRAAFVFPLSVLSNYMNQSEERTSITFKHQIIIWWAGLMRGAVSIALAFNQFTYSGVTMIPVHATMVTNTVCVVLFSTLVFGFLTKPLIMVLLPPHARDNHQIPEHGSPEHDMTLPLLSFDESATTNMLRAKDSLSMLLERPVYTIHFYWRKFDDTYMRPVFGGPSR
ncbi:Na+/H+ exchanger [Macleaya cordata]|uniref:Na+/H+ exchanger n=1 Tax=Macleaya cordata TaxID=56857 RepID=A0A200QFK0_MACCD|nr:Na+/H+ exchanger [Macleaya cordata]